MTEVPIASEHKNTGKVRTDLHCTECGKNFIATLDYDIDGDHEIICPHCGHQHCRVIKNGVVTSDRWSSRNGTPTEAKTQRLWTDESRKIQTSGASHFLREKWLNIGI